MSGLITTVSPVHGYCHCLVCHASPDNGSLSTQWSLDLMIWHLALGGVQQKATQRDSTQGDHSLGNFSSKGKRDEMLLAGMRTCGPGKVFPLGRVWWVDKKKPLERGSLGCK